MFRFLGQDSFEDLVLVGSNKKATTLGDLSLPLNYQFMLTLVKLRRNFQYEDMAVRFGIQQKHTSQVFKVSAGQARLYQKFKKNGCFFVKSHQRLFRYLSYLKSNHVHRSNHFHKVLVTISPLRVNCPIFTLHTERMGRCMNSFFRMNSIPNNF